MSVSVQFFVDFAVIQHLDSKNIDAAKGHLIILGHYDQESSLRIAALLDGSSIDFMFGVNNTTQGSASRIKVNNVKKFMRNLDVPHQEQIAKFYGRIYQAVVDYYNWRESTWCCCFDTQKAVMTEAIEAAFQDLRTALGDNLRL